MTKKYYELHLPYFKQGDDLRHYWDKAKTTLGKGAADKQAMREHASCLRAAADILCKLAEHTESGLSIADADTHYIGIKCEEKLGDTLVKDGLLYKNDWGEEE